MKIPTNVLRPLNLFSGPVIALLVWSFADLVPNKPEATLMAGVTLWVALWWMTEVVDLAVTSLLPLVLMPLMGIMDMKEVASQYMDHVIFLFVGGFILSFAVEKWGLHQRISLGLLSLIGDNPSRILIAIMTTTFFISMWISNTATVLMLYPAVVSIIGILQNTTGKATLSSGKALLLGLAYAASIGGMATLVGTPTNMIFYSYFTQNYPDITSLNFASWFGIGFPVASMLGVFSYFLLRFLFIPKEENQPFDKSLFQDMYRKLGKITYEEKVIAALFLITALLWFTRSDLVFGEIKFKGWSNLAPNPKWVQDSTVAIFMALLLFFIPASPQKQPSLSKTDKLLSLEEVENASELQNTILSWKDVHKFPFGILLLFGGGFALAKGFERTGLSLWLSEKLTFLNMGIPLLLVVGICIIICIISEFASNVASIQLTLPILATLHDTMGISPLMLMVPATLAASLGFMLPVATAPNTIVFSSRKVPVASMMKTGFWLDIAGVVLISTVGYFLTRLWS